MSSTEPETKRPVLRTAALVGGAGVLLAFLYLAFATSSAPTPRKAAQQSEDDPLEAARSALEKATDLNTCRGALQQVNAHLQRDPANRPPLPGDLGPLAGLFHLDEGERAEVLGGNYTLLDAHHLDQCFLLRDAAHSLDVRGTGVGDGRAASPAPLERAEAAFAWVVRQVRLYEHGAEPVPPAFALRRGWGSALERALVFLALLEQVGPGDEAPAAQRLDLLGCLLFHPDSKPDAPRLWACGVVVNGGPDVYLFDPRLGLPLPGPAGRGVASLAQARQDPAVLAQLSTDAKHPYDVNAQQAGAAELCLATPLSALAPRMRPLQDRFLAPAVRVRLAVDGSGDLQVLSAAARASLGKEAARVWPEGTGILRDFLPPEEGGVDPVHPFALRELHGFTTPDDPAVVQMHRERLFTMGLVPWTAFPPPFRDPRHFPYNLGLGERLRSLFLQPFVRSALEPGGPRDLLLRGRFNKAAPELVSELENWRDQQRRRETMPDLDRAVEAWVRRAIGVYADLERARRGELSADEANRAERDLWGDEAVPILALVSGALAGPRSAEATYLLGLCKHEQAERLQARLDLAGRAPEASPNEADARKAQDAWKDALFWWRRFTEDYPDRPEGPTARRLRGRAQALLGDREGAVASWEDLSGPLTEPEKVAHLYLARRLKEGAGPARPK